MMPTKTKTERPMRWRYVEVTYTPSNSDVTWFRAYVLEARSPEDAMRRAADNTRLEHPGATNVEGYMSRTLTDQKARQISDAMRAGSWKGWPLGV